MRKGYSLKEIADDDKTKTLTVSSIRHRKETLMSQGMISKEEIETAVQKHEQEKLEEMSQEIWEQIKEYTRQGYSTRELPGLIGYYREGIRIIKRRFSEEQGWFSPEELQEFKEKRQKREQEAEKRKKAQERKKKKESEMKNSSEKKGNIRRIKKEIDINKKKS